MVTIQSATSVDAVLGNVFVPNILARHLRTLSPISSLGVEGGRTCNSRNIAAYHVLVNIPNTN